MDSLEVLRRSPRGPTGQAKRYPAIWWDATGQRHYKFFAVKADAENCKRRMMAGARLTRLSVQLGEAILAAREAGGRAETRRLVEHCTEIFTAVAQGKKASSAVQLDMGQIESQRRMAF